MEMVGAKTIDELRGVPTDTMRKASHAVSGVIPQPGKIHTPANLVWVPVPDDLVAADSFPGWPDNLPVLMGCTENEARYFIKPGGPQLPFPRNIAIAMLNWIKPGGVYSWAIVERIVAGIAGGRASEVSALLRRSGKKPYECLDWLMTSIIFKEPLHESTQRFMGLNRTFYCYDFARVSPGERRSRLLAQHTSEIRYLFGNLTTDGQYDETDRKIAEELQSAWTSFARTGVPRSTDGAAWPALEAAAPRYMTIGDELSRRPYASSDMVRLVASLRDA
jgi:para-nitrobenzyl esterase